jgi:PAS domain-containing protein
MSGSGFQLSLLRDSRLAPLATSALPAWLWSTDGNRIVWANAAGAAVFGAPTSAAIGSRQFTRSEPAPAQIARVAATLSPGAAPRLERLRGFGAGIGRALTCACSHILLSDDTPAILVVALERAGPDLPLGERVARLLAGGREPIAAFSAEGQLIAATAGAQAYLHGATSLAAIAADAPIAGALASGHAVARDGSAMSLDRIGGEATTVLLARFGAPAAGTSTESAPVPPLSPATPTERRHPLRFVWQMDEGGNFTLSSDEFIALTGARTAAANGRPWQDVATELGLDPGGQVARALATHDTWSGLSVLWPVETGSEQLAIELSGLPVFDRNRAFRGYRGFGVCRDLERLTALARRLQSPRAAVPESAAPTTPIGGDSVPAQTPPADASDTENIVPFPIAAEPIPPALSPIERSAFRELSRKLSQRLTAAGIEHDREIEKPIEDDGAVVGYPAQDAVPDAQPVFDRVPVGVLVYRLDHLLYANPAFLQWTGHQNLEELVEAGGLDQLFIEPIGTAVAGDDKSLTLAIDRGDKISVRGELIDITWQGEPAHALVTAAQPATAAGEPEKLARTQAELAELETILDTATDGVVMLDAQGLIVSANRSAQALFGYESHELAGRTYTDLFAPESVDVAREYLDGLTRNGVACSTADVRSSAGFGRAA